MTATSGVLGRCAHCQTLLDLAPWHLNAMAMREPFACNHCGKALKLDCPEQLKRFKTLGSIATLRAMLIVLCATVWLVTLVLEWIGLVSLAQQLWISALMLLLMALDARGKAVSHASAPASLSH